ncbi:hypothetical protein BH10ACT1_BH10ACT1_17260 [soil metagenome]
MLETLILVLARLFLEDTDGVADVDEIAARIVEDLSGIADFDLPASKVEELLGQYASGSSALTLAEGRLVDLTVFAAGVPFAHRLTRRELDADELELDADLAIVGRIAGVDGGLHRRDAEPLRLRLDRQRGAGLGGGTLISRALVGPAGWLAGHTESDVVLVTVSDGYLDLATAEAPVEDARAFAERVRTELDAAKEAVSGGDDLPVAVEEVQAAGLLAGWLDRSAPSPPFGEVLDAAGFERSGTLVSRPGTWERFRELEVLIGVLASHGGHLEDGGRGALAGFVKEFDKWRHQPEGAPDPSVLRALGDEPEAALCLEEELVRLDPEGHDLHRFLDAFDATSGATAALATLRAFTANLEGDAAAVAEQLTLALAADAHAVAAVEASAFLAEVRGRPREAAELMRRVRLPDDPDLQVLEARAKAANPTVGRNDPCPCGSGRKFKQCHQGKTLMPVGTRLYWLLDKARADLLRSGPVDLLQDLSAPSDEAQALADDVALFDRGGLARFLERRRELLPVEDVALLERWLEEARQSVFGLAFGEPDSTVVGLVDQVTGERTTVWRTEAFLDLELDDLLWCRLLPDTEGGWWSSGIAVPLSPGDAELVLATGDDPVSRHGALLGLDVQVRQLASDGQPMVWGVTSWDLHDDDATVEAALDAAFERADDEWLVRDGDVVVGRLRLLPGLALAELKQLAADDDREFDFEDVPASLLKSFLTGRTDSVARHQSLQARIAEVLPSSVVSWSSVEPISRHLATQQAEDLLEIIYADDDEYDDDEGFDDDEDGPPRLEL